MLPSKAIKKSDIVVDYSRDNLFDELGLRRLKDSYMRPDEKSPQDRFRYVAMKLGSNKEHAQRLYDYASKHWLSFSTPILSYGTSKRGLPISCYLSYIDDSAEGLVDALAEVCWLSMLGGGVGIGVGIRAEDNKSVGVMPHLKVYETSAMAYRQGKCYHPDVEVLTEVGFLPFKEAASRDLKVLQVSTSGDASFVRPIEWVEEDYDDVMVRLVDSKNIDISVTADHRIFFKRQKKTSFGRVLSDSFEIDAAGIMPKHRDIFLQNSVNTVEGTSDLTAYEKFLIAFQADGSYLPSGCEFHFKKERKVTELLEILNSAKVEFTYYRDAAGDARFYVKDTPVSKTLSWVSDLSKVSSKWASSFLKEIQKWDSYTKPPTSTGKERFVYTSVVKENADIVQAMASIAGRKARVTLAERDESRQPIHTVYITESTNFCLEQTTREFFEYKGKVHCAVVPDGGLVVRSNGHTLVCGNTRRGSFAAYLDISHPNVMQFIEMRKPTGDMNQRCLELHHGVNVSDKFMQLIEKCMLEPDADDSWPLIDPHTNEIKEVVSAKRLWEAILDTRMRTGEPYLHFIDASNRGLPEFQKALGLKVQQSNICTEITLATDAERTAVCCLSSPNLEYWDEWKDNYMFYRDVAELLDNALEVFIKKAPKTVKRAIYSASRERSIGVGALGFHALLQKKNIPFESAQAVGLNLNIFKRYDKYLKRANRELALERGSCPDAAGFRVPTRFSHTTSIAPNATSSIIMGNTSPSIEPYRGNAYRQDTLSGSFLNKNRHLENVLLEHALTKFKDPDRAQSSLDGVWSTIVTNAGSVQHLDFLDDHTKAVFKTASEIDQMWVVQHAADRQKNIDQAQSVNLIFKADAPVEYIHHVHFQAWKRGLKTLYYCRSDKIYHGENISKQSNRVKFEFDKTTQEACVACEG